MNKIAILYICTGKYDAFWNEFYKSCEDKFCKKSKKDYFVFTDSKKIKSSGNIHVVEQNNLGWPGNTLMRFHMFSKIEKKLQNYDYIFFFNANSLIVEEIKEQDFLPSKDEILVVKHPGYYNKKRLFYPYERRKKSTAYIKRGSGKYYVCGGVNGGSGKEFLKLMNELKNNIDIDNKNNIIAKWHDESHINCYISKHDNYRILSPSYCYYDGLGNKIKPIIIMRNKSDYFNVDNDKRKSIFARCKTFIRKMFGKLIG